MSAPLTRRLVAVMLAVLALGVVACDGGSSGGAAIDTPPAQVTPPAATPALVAALERAQALHQRADALRAAGRPAEAAASVLEILAVTFPAGAPEAEDVQLDARARAALLLRDAGELDRAEDLVDAGLTAATRESFVLANLFAVRSTLFEARAARTSDPEARANVLRQAIAMRDRSLAINERIQIRLAKEVAP